MLSPASRTGRQPGAWPQRGFIRCRLDASTIRCPHAAAPDFWRNRAQRPHSLCSREPAQRICSSCWGQATLGLRPGRNVSGMVATLCAQSGVNVVNSVATLCRTWRQHCGDMRAYPRQRSTLNDVSRASSPCPGFILERYPPSFQGTCADLDHSPPPQTSPLAFGRSRGHAQF